jgi:hypothetical protein
MVARHLNSVGAATGGSAAGGPVYPIRTAPPLTS